MASTRRVLGNLSVKPAGRSAGCKHNKKHRVAKGEYRLLIKNPGPASGEVGYCAQCGLKILEAAHADVQKLTEELAESVSK